MRIRPPGPHATHRKPGHAPGFRISGTRSDGAEAGASAAQDFPSPELRMFT